MKKMLIVLMLLFSFVTFADEPILIAEKEPVYIIEEPFPYLEDNDCTIEFNQIVFKDWLNLGAHTHLLGEATNLTDKNYTMAFFRFITYDIGENIISMDTFAIQNFTVGEKSSFEGMLLYTMPDDFDSYKIKFLPFTSW